MLTLNMSAFGVKRTSLVRSLMSANDPKRTSSFTRQRFESGVSMRDRVERVGA